MLSGSDNRIVMGQDSSIAAMGYDDTFVFRAGFGRSSIAGYEASGIDADTIVIDDSVFDSWADMMASATQSGDDVLLTAGPNDVITLEDTLLATLQQSKFQFADL